jgi:predicted alpha/beta-fold hydrolase
MSTYRAPLWLRGSHLQTIYASALMPRPRVTYRRERWDTPDGDFIDLDWVEQDRGLRIEGRGEAPLVVLFHGLEGSSRSHYARALMAALGGRGMRGVVVHFRGCSGEPNRLPRVYHSGDAPEIDWILRRLRAQNAGAPLFAVGVSLGGNVLLKWLGETGASALEVVDRAAAVSAPVDLMISGDALGKGFNLIYTRHFLMTLKRKALEKHALFPGLFDAARLHAASTLREFDDLVTAPLHGYKNTDDYWTRASSKPGLQNIRVPTLVLNARNDPFLPASALPGASGVSAAVTLEQSEHGGHVGFVTGPFPGRSWLPQRVLEYFRTREVSGKR